MRVLIVHDRKEISDKIVATLHSAEPEIIIDVAEDYVSGTQFLRKNIYDLLILDLTIPHTQTTKPNYETASNLLHELIDSESLNTPGDLIGITRDSEAFETISSDVNSHVMTVIKEDTNENWLDELIEKIKYVCRAANARYRVTASTYDYDVLIVTALDEELDAYSTHFELSTLTKSDVKEFGFTDRHGVIRRGVAAAFGRSGQAVAASRTQSLVTQFRPRLSVMSGFCGTIEGKAKLGECLIFESVFDWDYGKWKDDDGGKPVFVPRPEPIVIRGSHAHRLARELAGKSLPISEQNAAKAKELSPTKTIMMTPRLIAAASGSAVVAHVDLTSRIKLLNDSITGIDMESYGFYHACKYTMAAKPEMVCIKAVSDFCDFKKGDEYHRLCAFMSSEVVRHLIVDLWDYDE